MLVRSAKRLVKSVTRVGVLQPPSIVRLPYPSGDQQSYEVIAGRRRVLAARLAGLSMLKCEVYEQCTPQLSAFLALIENAQRSAARIKEVNDLHRLIDERVGMTLEELTACGFERDGLVEWLKIARLPAPLLSHILAGKVSFEVARKMTRLGESQLARLCQVAEEEELTADVVEQALKVQIETKLAPLQASLPAFPSLASLSDLHASMSASMPGSETLSPEKNVGAPMLSASVPALAREPPAAGAPEGHSEQLAGTSPAGALQKTASEA